MFGKNKQEKFTSGYHGTTASGAEDIMTYGIAPSRYADKPAVYFSPDYETAKFIAKMRATERRDPRFAVIEATFPQQRVAETDPYNIIRVMGRDIGHIALEGVKYFDTATTEVSEPERL